MMFAVTIVHVLACFVLVLVVLLQAGKGADIGAVFGGASTTIFGSSGAGSFLTRLTTGAAIVFMATSLTLTYGSTRSTTTTIMPESAVPSVPREPLAGVDTRSGAADEVAQDAAAGGEAVPAAPAGANAADAPAAGGAAPEAAAAGPQPAEPPAAP